MGRSAALGGAKRIKSIDPFSASQGVVDADRGRVYNNAPDSAAREASRLPRKLRALLALRRASDLKILSSRPRAPESALDSVGDRRPGEPLAAYKRRVYAAATAARAASRVASLHGISAKRQAYFERKGLKRSKNGSDDGFGGDGAAPNVDAGDRDDNSGGRALPQQASTATRGTISAQPPAAKREHNERGTAATRARDEAEGAIFADTFGTHISEYSAHHFPDAARRDAKRARAADDGEMRYAEAAPRFGERVEAPPRLTVLPRPLKAERMARSIAAAMAPKASKPAKLDKRAREAARNAGAARPAATVHVSAAREAVIEAERDAARAAFAALKERRREAFAAAAQAAAASRTKTGPLRVAASGA